MRLRGGPTSVDPRPRTKFVDERAWRHAGDRAELGDEVRLVVVTRGSGDAGPAHAAVMAGVAQRAMEAREPGECLGADAQGLAKHTAQVPGAHAKVCGDNVHARALQPPGGFECETRLDTASLRGAEALGDGAFQRRGRLGHAACAGEPIEQLRAVVPQILECDSVPGDGGSGRAENRFVHAQTKTRHQDPLAAANQLAMHLLPCREHMCIESVPCHRSEANDDLGFQAGHQGASRIAVDHVQGEGGHGGRGRSFLRQVTLVNVVRAHGPIIQPLGELMGFRPFMSVSSNSRRGRDATLQVMKILITGATGKVGSRLAKRLALRGDHVRALVRDPARAAPLQEAGVEIIQGDLQDADSLATAVHGIEAVVHCAAFFRGATPEQAHAVNDLGTQHLAHAARDASVRRFLFTSTGLVYGANGGQLAREDDLCAPTVAYPVSKLAAERFLLELQGLDVRVLRLPFVYGDGDPHIEEVVPAMRGFPPAQRMSIAHHVDVAQAVTLLLDAPSPAHRIYNVVGDEAPTLGALFASVGAPPPDGSNAEFARAFDALMDGRRIREELGFMPRFPGLETASARE